MSKVTAIVDLTIQEVTAECSLETINVGSEIGLTTQVVSCEFIPTSILINDDEWGRYALNTKYSITTNVSDGIVIQGVIQGDTCYRYITNSLDANGYPNEDSFYSDFDGTNLTNLITTRG
jgi:hypothetical protein